MNHESVATAHHRYAPVYTLLFGGVFEPGRRRLVQALDCRAGYSVLEVGMELAGTHPVNLFGY